MSNHRIAELQKTISKFDVDMIFISDINDIRYLSGFTGSMAYMIISAGESRFFTDGRYQEQIKSEVANDIEITIIERYQAVFQECAKYKRVMLQPSCSVAISSILMSLGISVAVDDRDILKRMRMIKSSDEMTFIHTQYKLAAEAFTKALPTFKAGLEEKVWAATLEYNMKILGADSVSFETIVASGTRGALPHGVASNKIIEQDDAVLMDFGSQCGYTSDYTRMLYNGNEKFFYEIVDIVYDAVHYAIDGIKVGSLASDIDKIAREHIENKGYGKYFNHSLGHGVGLDVHELPTVNQLSDTILEEGMVFTIEPGIYLPDKFGVRLEDTVHISSNGVDLVSKYLDNYVYQF